MQLKENMSIVTISICHKTKIFRVDWKHRKQRRIVCDVERVRKREGIGEKIRIEREVKKTTNELRKSNEKKAKSIAIQA